MKTVRLATQARVATHSNSPGLKVSVLLQKKGLVFIDQALDLANIDRTHASVLSQQHRTQPKFAFAGACSGNDVRPLACRGMLHANGLPDCC